MSAPIAVGALSDSVHLIADSFRELSFLSIIT